MFSKAKKNQPKSQDINSALVEVGEDSETLQRAPAHKAKQAPTKMLNNGRSTKPAPRNAGVPSLISSDVVIRGSVEAQGEVQFDGTLEGDVQAKGLVIGEGAMIKGEVVADHVKVSGNVDGAIRADKVELAASAVVKGDILHTSLSIESGARLDGNCRYSENPKSDKGAAPAKKAVRSVSSPRVVSTQSAEMAAEEPAELIEEMTDGSLEIAADENSNIQELKSVAQSGSSFLSRAGKSDLR